MSTLQALFDTLHQRKRPEDVAEMILAFGRDQMTSSEVALLEKAAKGSLARNAYHYSSMAQDFSKAVGAQKQLNKTFEIFKVQNQVDGNNAEKIETFIREISPLIDKGFGQNSFIENRLNKQQREEKKLDLSKRQYNKKWRLLKRLEAKLQRFIRENKKNEIQQIAKHGIAHHLSYDAFAQDNNTAYFIAYYNARCNLRSVFTNQSQVRAFDEISEMLLKRCFNTSKSVLDFLKAKKQEQANTTNWWAIAYVYTSQEVLSNLTASQKGELLGRWTNILQDISSLLEEVWAYSHIDRDTMIVRRGNDSTTWNNTAGAWNKARDNWMNLIYAMGLEKILDEICFGKVLRLMAADVVYWHKSSGGGLDPNTEVWKQLPLPWEVFGEKAFCNRQMVNDVCKKAGIDAEKTGWIAPRIHGVAAFTPTPELVHGVAVNNPFLAKVLKQHKYYSGKNATPFHPEKN